MYENSYNDISLSDAKIQKIYNFISGKKLFIRFTIDYFTNAYQFLRVSFFPPFGLQSGMWNCIILIPDHWLSIYLTQAVILTNKYACPMSEISYNDI